MKIMISVQNAVEAEIAIQCGAKWIDVKDPAAGPLGRAELATQRQILQRCRPAVRGSTPDQSVTLSVALGEAVENRGLVFGCSAFTPPDSALGDSWQGDSESNPAVGFDFAKLGLSRIDQFPAEKWQREWVAWSRRLPKDCQAVVVAYADADTCGGLDLPTALALAQSTGQQTVLVDTFDKRLPGVLRLCETRFSPQAVPAWIDQAKQQGITLVWAGKLSLTDLHDLAGWGAAVAGVRSAVCTGLRQGAICPDRVAQVLSLSD